MKRALVVVLTAVVAGCQQQRMAPQWNGRTELLPSKEWPSFELTAAERAQILADAPRLVEQGARVSVRFVEEPYIWTERVNGVDRVHVSGDVAAYNVFGTWTKRRLTLDLERKPWGFDLPNGPAVGLSP